MLLKPFLEGLSGGWQQMLWDAVNWDLQPVHLTAAAASLFSLQ